MWKSEGGGAAREMTRVKRVSGPLRAQVHTNQIYTLIGQFDAVYFFAECPNGIKRFPPPSLFNPPSLRARTEDRKGIRASASVTDVPLGEGRGLQQLLHAREPVGAVLR